MFGAISEEDSNCSSTPPQKVGRLLKLIVVCNRMAVRFIVTACGGTLTDPTGVIQSPRYPEPYVNRRSTCKWVISAPVDRRLTIEFNDIDLIMPDMVRVSYSHRLLYYGIRTLLITNICITYKLLFRSHLAPNTTHSHPKCSKIQARCHLRPLVMRRRCGSIPSMAVAAGVSNSLIPQICPQVYSILIGMSGIN